MQAVGCMRGEESVKIAEGGREEDVRVEELSY